METTLYEADRIAPVGVLYWVSESDFNGWSIEGLRLRGSDVDQREMDKRRIDGFDWIERIRW
jgi:hypothetical protein